MARGAARTPSSSLDPLWSPYRLACVRWCTQNGGQAVADEQARYSANLTFRTLIGAPVTSAVESLSAQALHLPPAERLEVVDRILDSLDAPDSSVDALWADEAVDRLAAYRRGEVRAKSLSEVIAKYPGVKGP